MTSKTHKYVCTESPARTISLEVDGEIVALQFENCILMADEAQAKAIDALLKKRQRLRRVIRKLDKAAAEALAKQQLQRGDAGVASVLQGQGASEDDAKKVATAVTGQVANNPLKQG